MCRANGARRIVAALVFDLLIQIISEGSGRVVSFKLVWVGVPTLLVKHAAFHASLQGWRAGSNLRVLFVCMVQLCSLVRFSSVKNALLELMICGRRCQDVLRFKGLRHQC